MVKKWVGMKKRYREESPLYRFTKTNINNGEYWVINLEAKPYDKYLPFNFCSITNNTDQEIILILDDKFLSIPSGVIRSIDEETVPAFRTIKVANLSGANATGKIELLIQKMVSQRMILRRWLLGENE